MYTCIIVDDESHVIEGLTRYIAKVPNLTIRNTYTDPCKALSEITSFESVDLILMDIDMPEISGIELAKEIRLKTSKLVFTTAHSKFGYEAFKVEADGYLLKPYTLSEFIFLMNKLFPYVEQQKGQAALSSKKEEFFFVKSKEDNLKLIKLWYDEVISIESRSNYVLINTKDKSITSYMSLSDIADIFSHRDNFLKFQRSFIVNTSRISSVQGNIIFMETGSKIVVGDQYRKSFNEFINRNLVKARRID